MQRRYILAVAAVVALALMLTGSWLLRGNADAGSRGVDPPSRVPTAVTPTGSVSANGAEAARQLAAHFDLELDQAVPDGNASEVIAELAPLAEAGDAIAARRLYLKLRECKLANEDNLSARYEPSSVSPELVSESGLTNEQFLARFERDRLAGIEHTLVGCRGLPATVDADMRKWLTQGAMAGDIAAGLLYAADSRTILGTTSDMIRDPGATIAYKRNAMRFVGTAAEAGVPEAMLQLSGAYENGILAGRDPVMAYAWRAAASRDSPDPLAAKILAIRRKGLSASQLADAQARADAIYARCCRR